VEGRGACPTASPFEVAATVIHSYDTAWYALADRAQLAKGETVVVTGAGGGVGMAAVDVALHLGGEVIAAIGSEGHVAALPRARREARRQLLRRRTCASGSAS
jgi:NADPH2:quinone reductase